MHRCVHGFPDTWFGWRHQIRALATAGYHVIVPDQRGYGETHFPARLRPPSSHFRQELACADMAALLDALCIQRVILLGHDWGGTLVWNMAMKYPDRVAAVAAVCTPFFPVNPAKNPWAAMQAKPGRFDYQLWFQTDSAEAELNAGPGPPRHPACRAPRAEYNMQPAALQFGRTTCRRQRTTCNARSANIQRATDNMQRATTTCNGQHAAYSMQPQHVTHARAPTRTHAGTCRPVLHDEVRDARQQRERPRSDPEPRPRAAEGASHREGTSLQRRRMRAPLQPRPRALQSLQRCDGN
jgi:pimeloyl-ACP methyl ester carboxylesterase